MPNLSINLSEWESRSPDTDPRLRGRYLDNHPDVQTVARLLSEGGILQVRELRHGMAVTASSYVGRIEIGTLEVTVRPKIEGMRLACLLRYAYGLRDLRLLAEAGYGVEPETFQDLLIDQLTAETSELLSRGLHRQYVSRNAELSSPRGRIDFRELSARGGKTLATLPCTHYPRLDDCPVNQVLLAGIDLALGLTGDTSLRTKLRCLGKILRETITKVRLDNETLQRFARTQDRLTAAYVPAITIIRVLLAAQGTTLTDGGSRLVLPGFMFDMNRFFQTLLSRFLREHLGGYMVRDEYSLRDMMAYVPSRNPLRRLAPQPRPDFVIMDNGKVVAILDAKYRDLWNNPLPREMLYQLAVYALALRSCRAATILYPSMDARARESWISIQDPVGGSYRAHVVLRPVVINQLADLLADRNTTMNIRAREMFAKRLAFGETV